MSVIPPPPTSHSGVGASVSGSTASVQYWQDGLVTTDAAGGGGEKDSLKKKKAKKKTRGGGGGELLERRNIWYVIEIKSRDSSQVTAV